MYVRLSEFQYRRSLNHVAFPHCRKHSTLPVSYGHGILPKSKKIIPPFFHWKKGWEFNFIVYRIRNTDLHVVKHDKDSYILKNFTLIVEVYNSCWCRCRGSIVLPVSEQEPPPVDWGVAEELDDYRGSIRRVVVRRHLLEHLTNLPYCVMFTHVLSYKTKTYSQSRTFSFYLSI